MGSSATRGQSVIHAPFPVRIWHLASLDAPTVAVVWCLAFAWVASVHFPWWVLVLIPSGVWAVYVTDRLLDARRGIRSLSHDHLRDRHLFHWRHRPFLIPAAAASTVVAAWIIFALMPGDVRQHDSLLAVASLVYFTRVHARRKLFQFLSKEFLVGVLFTLGCAVPAWSRAQFSSEIPWWAFAIASVFFALLAWLNCCAIDRWESPDDHAAGFPIASLAWPLSATSLLGSALLLSSHFRAACLLACAALAALLLAVLDRVRNRLTPVTLRAAADLALLTPAILLALAPLLRK